MSNPPAPQARVVGLESITLTPEGDRLRVRAVYRSAPPVTVEAISLDVLLPVGNRSLRDLEYEAISRARDLLLQTLALHTPNSPAGSSRE